MEFMRIEDMRTGAAALMLALAAAGCSDSGDVEPAAGRGGDGPFDVEVNFSIGMLQETDLFGRGGTRYGFGDYVFDPMADGYGGAYRPHFSPEPPRELESSNDWQQVNDVRLYVFRKNEAGDFVYYKPSDKDGAKQAAFAVKDFSDKFALSRSVVWWGGSADVSEAHSYTVKAVLPEGEYHFLAVARDDDWVADKLLTEPELEWVEEETRLTAATLGLSASSATVAATELFAGCTAEPVVVDGTGEFQKAIELKRAVAGLMVYVENVPARLAAWQGFAADGETPVRAGDSYAVSAIGVTHGRSLSDKVCLLGRSAVEGGLAHGMPLGRTYALKQGLEAYATTAGTGDNGSYYVNTAPDDPSHPNSMLLGAYLMPQPAGSGAEEEDESDCGKLYKSLYLVFYHRAGGNLWPLQWWPVRMEEASGTADSPYYFPFEANHFYRLGDRRFSADGTTVERDEPLDLRNGQEFVIGVDGKWEGEYDYEIIN